MVAIIKLRICVTLVLLVVLIHFQAQLKLKPNILYFGLKHCSLTYIFFVLTVTHGCIVADLKLYLPDGKEAKAR